MPIFKIETRSKGSESEEAKPETEQGAQAGADPRSERSPRADRSARPEQERRKRAGREAAPTGVSAVMFGIFVGMALLLGVTAALIGSQMMRGRDAGAPGSAPGGAAPIATPASAAQPLQPGPINGDYPLTHNVAYVNGEPYSMAQLEKAVRVARTLGRVAGDPVPGYMEQEFLGFQVKILKRQVDLKLLYQSMLRSGMTPPEGPVDDLIIGFLQQVGASQDALNREMVENSVSRADLDDWFATSRATNVYVLEQLMGDRDPSERDIVVQAWLDEQWSGTGVVIDFYDPGLVLPPTPTALPVDSGSAP
jgi:hypothetical protein